MSRTVEIELDDVAYVMEYSYERPRPATYWEPASGGVELNNLYIVLEGASGPIQINVTEHADDLKVTDWLVGMAYEREREIA